LSTRSDVFRFVTVRAPRRQLEIPNRPFLPYGEQALQPPLHARLLAMKSQPDAEQRIRQEAARYLASSRYVGAATKDPLFSTLERAYVAGLGALKRKRPVRKAVEDALGGPVAGFAATLGDAGERIWESMYSAYAAGRTPTADVERQVALARSVAVLRALASSGEDSAANPLFRGEPVLPRDLFPIAPPAKTDPFAAERERRAKLRDRVKTLKLDAWRRASALESALRHIEALPSPGPKDKCETPGALSWRQIAALPAEVRASLEKDGIRIDQPLSGLRAAIQSRPASWLSRISAGQRRPRAVARVLNDPYASDLVRLELGSDLASRNLDYEVLFEAVQGYLPDAAPGAARAEWPAQGEAAVRLLGIADLRVVRQTLLRYQLGEVAHIENVLAGETREQPPPPGPYRRDHRNRNRARFRDRAQPAKHGTFRAANRIGADDSGPAATGSRHHGDRHLRPRLDYRQCRIFEHERHRRLTAQRFQLRQGSNGPGAPAR
jgi:hypothetical protein